MNNFLQKIKHSSKLTVLLTILNVLLFQWFSYGLYFRQDISQAGNMRITSASKKILKDLPSPVTIEAYFSTDVPTVYLQPATLVRDFLREYANVSNARLVFLDPDKDEETRLRAQNMGIQPMSLGAIGERKQEISNAYFSLVILYQDKKEVLPNVLSTASTGMLEYQLTSRIYAMAYPQQRGLGLIGSPEFKLFNKENPIQGFSGLDQLVADFYGHIRPINIASENIPVQTKNLLVVNPKELTPKDLFALDQFLLRGNNIIFAVSSTDIDFYSYQVLPKKYPLHSLLAHYGLQLEKDMVYEGKNLVPIRQPVNAMQTQEVPIPSWLLILPNELSSDSVITSSLDGLFVPWASSIDIVKEKLPYQTAAKKQRAKAIVLAKTSNQSWIQNMPVSVAPAEQRDLYLRYKSGAIAKDGLKSSVVSVYTEGFFDSYFSGKELPPDIDAQSYLPTSAKKGKLLLISTPYALTDVGIGQESNRFFFLNALDSMNGLQDLVKARSSGNENPQLPMLSAWVKQLIVVLTFLFPLLVVVGFAILHFVRRKALANLQYNQPVQKQEQKQEQKEK